MNFIKRIRKIANLVPKMTVVTKISQGIRISVQTKYREEQSQPERNHFFFSYHITIENLTDYSVQLLYRKWNILDSNGDFREVEGAGVVGVQPFIEPGATFEYQSACNLTTDFGRMDGYYIFCRQFDNFNVLAEIPAFNLIVPWKLN